MSIAAEVSESVEVTLDEGASISLEGELDIPHPGISKNHVEAVELPCSIIYFYHGNLRPVNLGLFTRLGLKAVNCLDSYGHFDLANESLYWRIAAFVTLFMDFFEQSDGTQGIFLEPTTDVLLVWVKLAWFLGLGLVRWCLIIVHIFTDSLSGMTRLASNSSDT